MKVTLKSELNFIKKEGVLEGYVEPLGNGLFVFKDGTFKQILKQKEYDAVLVASMSSLPKKEEEKELSREDQLKKLDKTELLMKLSEFYDNIDQNMKKDEIIKLIIQAEEE